MIVHIVHILKPCRNDPDTIDAQEKFVLDAKLLEKVLQAPIFTVKSIPHACRFVFPQRLKMLFIRWLLSRVPWVSGFGFTTSSLHIKGFQASDYAR